MVGASSSASLVYSEATPSLAPTLIQPTQTWIAKQTTPTIDTVASNSLGGILDPSKVETSSRIDTIPETHIYPSHVSSVAVSRLKTQVVATPGSQPTSTAVTQDPEEHRSQTLAAVKTYVKPVSQRHHAETQVEHTRSTTTSRGGGTTLSPSTTLSSLFALSGLQLSQGFHANNRLPSSDRSKDVVVQGETFTLGAVRTVGSGASVTTISLLQQSGSTYALYGHTATILITSPAVKTRTATAPRSRSSIVPQPTISRNSRSQFVVDGQTLAPGLPITLHEEGSPETFRMLTSSSHTYVAIGTSTTIMLADNPATVASDESIATLHFLQALDGNFVLHGTTLVSGYPVTIGSGSAKTTLRLTTISSKPAVVLDETVTEQLGRVTPSSHITSSPDLSLPSITRGPTSGVLTHLEPTVARSSSSSADSGRHAADDGRVVLAALCTVFVLATFN